MYRKAKDALLNKLRRGSSIESVKKNGWKGDPIDVVEMPDGIYTTIDNTRVVSAREAGINVQANVYGYNKVEESKNGNI